MSARALSAGWSVAKRAEAAGRALVVELAVVVGALALSPITAGPCDSPGKIGVEHFLAIGRDASLVWNGAGYGIVWIDGEVTTPGEPSEVFFARLDPAGELIGDATQVFAASPADRPALVGNGGGYGLVWRNPFLGSLFFAQIDGAGLVVGSDTLYEIAPDRIFSDPELVWTETAYGLAWDYDKQPRFTRLDTAAFPLSEAVLAVNDSRILESAVWNGFEFAVVSQVAGRYYIYRVDESGNLIEPEKLIAQGPVHTSAFPPRHRRASIVWDGVGYGVAVSLCESSIGSCDLVLVRLDAEGEPLDVTPVAMSTQNPDLAWNGTEYGLVWQLEGSPGTWFARVSAGGKKLGPDLMVTPGNAWQRGPRIVWADGEYGVTVEPTGVPSGDSIWFARVGCNCTDVDADEVTTCNGDCDDSEPSTFPGAPQLCDGLNNDCDSPDWPAIPPDEFDVDMDMWRACSGECDDANPAVHPGVPEVNDGIDNQCPGDDGFGLVDETGPGAGFHLPGDTSTYSWPAQPGATSYEVARSVDPRFLTDCSIIPTVDPFVFDAELPPFGGAFYYLNRAKTPHEGSWGRGSSGEERTVCP